MRRSHDGLVDVLLDVVCSFESVFLLLLVRKKFPKMLKTQLLFGRRADFVHAFSRRFSHVIELFVGLMNEIVGTFAHCISNFFNLFENNRTNIELTIIIKRKRSTDVIVFIYIPLN